MSEERVILVNEDDEKIGTEEKLKAHQGEGKLHRCFSIFVFNSQGEMLLQKRADEKYHCGGMWTNTCCSHPRPGEELEDAVHRRIEEEMGFDCPMKEIFTFIYRAEFDNGLTEHEFDHVFMGKYEEEPDPNPEEVGEWKWISPEDLKEDVGENPGKYTPWFKECFERVLSMVDF